MSDSEIRERRSEMTRLSDGEALLKQLVESREFALHIGADSSYGEAVLTWLWEGGIEPKAAHLPARPPKSAAPPEDERTQA